MPWRELIRYRIETYGSAEASVFDHLAGEQSEMYPGLPWDLRHGGGRFLRNQTETAGGRGARIGKVGNAPAIEQRSKAEGELSADKKYLILLSRVWMTAWRQLRNTWKNAKINKK